MCFSGKFSQHWAYNSDVRCTMSENQNFKRTEPIEMCSYKSPCVRNCCLDDKDICIGCGRTLDEICRWSSATNSGKQELLINSLARVQSRSI
ncbi:DUF1289 domain-containing protein [Vibrio mimicus]|uniref:DUF1289 domain-containing protein n=1 Tax=Vibrio mimicus TaxID=674 RepID=UPI002F95BD7E